jgi:8-amino-7-oxononanoate synthase
MIHRDPEAVAPQPTPGHASALQLSDETSLVDLLRAADAGVGFAELSQFFYDGVQSFEAGGFNLYRRCLHGPSDAVTPIYHAHERARREMLQLASNNYLGLAHDPRVVAAACDAAREFGAGAASSPLLVGTFEVSRRLETELAAFKSADDVCLFTTGYQANLGTISAIAQNRNDVIVLDRLAHASMVDAAKLSSAHVKVFRHNDAEHLDRVLSRNRDARVKLVCVEGIYSMDGDVAPLADLLRVTKKHGAMLLVDEAHSTGVLGPDGRGAVAHAGLEGEVDVQVGTLSKAFGASGGFVAGSHPLVNYVRYFARAGMFSTAISPMIVAAAQAALEIIRTEPARRKALWDNCNFMHAELSRHGFRLVAPPSPIMPIVVGSMHSLRQITLELHQANICVNSVPYPAVPWGSERLRISLTANHTREQLQHAVDCLVSAGRHAGIVL